MYYVKVATRGGKAAAKGTPRQALNYITDGHDIRRDPGYSDAELAYIARVGDGWKTELEGGRVPLVGYGELAGAGSEEMMTDRFEAACSPPAARVRAGVRDGKGGAYDRSATAGYRSFTFTLPKEVSLYAEGNRVAVQQAMHAAIARVLETAYSGKHFSAVGAIHTRNEAGEIHYHAHVLLGKFASEKDTGRIVSLNGRRGGNTGQAKLREIKAAWKESVDREIKERLGLTIEQRAPNSAPTLILADGTRLEPLDRDSRRLLEKEIAPWYGTPAGTGAAVIQRQLRLTAMDDRIFELASGARGGAGWDRDAFEKLFPEQARFLGRHDKRVETLKQIGYVTPDGNVTREFRIHFAVKHGLGTPELQRLRIDLANRVVREERRGPQRAKAPVRPAPSLWEALDRYEFVRKRVERLGFTRDDLRRIHAEAEKQKPTRERLAALRAEVEKRVALAPPQALPETKGIIRAFVGVQGMRVQRLYLLTESLATVGLRYRRNKELADQLKKNAERDLFYAKEERLAQLGRGLRPIFWAVRVAMPAKARRIEKAMERCSRLAFHQETRRVYREELQRAHKEWRQRFVELPKAELKRQAEELAQPEQAAGRRQVERVRSQIDLRDLEEAVRLLKAGTPVLEKLRPVEAAHIRKWNGKEEMLVREVVAASKGEAHVIPKEEYDATLKAGRFAHLLEVERGAKAPEVPKLMEQHAAGVARADARLAAFGIPSPFTSKPLKSVPPSAVKKGLGMFEKAGVMGDGPEWMLGAAAMRQTAATVNQLLERERDVERQLIDRLITGRNRS